MLALLLERTLEDRMGRSKHSMTAPACLEELASARLNMLQTTAETDPSYVVTVLAELTEEMAAGKLLEVAKLCPVSWSQRLGHLLELVGQEDLAAALGPFVIENARSYTPLRRAANIAGGKRNPRWKLIVNVEAEPDE